MISYYRTLVSTHCFSLLFLSFAAISSPAFADSLIVFSAQRYVYRSYTKVVPAEPGHHLYILSWPHGHITQITFGKSDDISPCLSNDKQRVAFLRMSPSGATRSYILNIATHRLHFFFDMGQTLNPACRWSPDNRFISLADDDTYSLTHGAEYAWIVGLNGRVTNYDNIQTITWAPDSKHVFLGSNNQQSKIATVNSAQRKQLHMVLPYGYWINNSDLICTPLNENRNFTWDFKLVAIYKLGNSSRTFYDPLTTKDGQDWNDDDAEHFMYVLAHGSRPSLMTIYHNASDWSHPQCFLWTRLGTPPQYLGEINYISPSPHWYYFIGTIMGWVGAYKRGGERLENLYIFRLGKKIGKEQFPDNGAAYVPGVSKTQITHGYWDIEGVDQK